MRTTKKKQETDLIRCDDRVVVRDRRRSVWDRYLLSVIALGLVQPRVRLAFCDFRGFVL